MKAFNFFCLPLLIFSQALESISSEPKLLGHNLSNTAYVLDSGECTLGFVHAACGLSEKLTVGSSPWMAIDYKMFSLALRYQVSSNDDTTEAFQASYFKTYQKRDRSIPEDSYYNPDGDYEYRGYEMEAIWLMYIRSKRFTPHFTLHYNFHVNYYLEDKAPFSLRRPYEKRSPWQINLSTLFEVDLYKMWFIQGELGLLDLLNSPIHTHAGASLGRKQSWGYFYFGFSYTSTLNALFSPSRRVDYQWETISTREDGYDSDLDSEKIKYDYAIHPEITIQFFF